MLKILIIGRIGKDAATNNVNGKTVINFNVCHSERYKDAGGNQKEKTTWVQCSWWTDRLTIVPYLLKGTLIYAEGVPETDVYENKAQQKMRVVNVQLLSKAEGAAESSVPTK